VKRKPQTTAEWIALIVIPVVSLLNIGFTHFFQWDYSFLISLLGFAFVISFVLDLKIYKILLFIYAFSQLVIIYFPLGDEVFDLSQVINLSVGIKPGSAAYIGLGVPGIFLLALATRVKMDSIFGTKLRLYSFKKDVNLEGILPADVEIVKRMRVGDESSWYLVKFLNTETEKCALIRGKDTWLIQPGKKQIVEFWWVEDPKWFLESNTVVKKLLRKPAWVVVE
jgi:hypothetical protein